MQIQAANLDKTANKRDQNPKRAPANQGLSLSGKKFVSSVQSQLDVSREPNGKIVLGKSDGGTPSDAATPADAETLNTVADNQRDAQGGVSRLGQQNVQVLQRKIVEDLNSAQPKTIDLKQEVSTKPGKENGVDDNAGKSLASAAQRRGVDWDAQSGQPFSQMMNLTDEGLSQVVTDALRLPNGQTAESPVKFQAFESAAQRGSTQVEALTSNGTIFLSDRMVALAKSDDPQARGVFASIVREELAEAAYQDQQASFSEGDFGNEANLRMSGEYGSLSNTQRDALLTESDTTSITVDGEQIVGEAAIGSNPETEESKKARTKATEQTQAQINEDIDEITENAEEQFSGIKIDDTSAATAIKGSSSQIVTQYFIAHKDGNRWVKGSVASKKTAYWVSISNVKGKPVPSSVSQEETRSFVKLKSVTFTAKKTKNGYKVVSGKSKGTLYTVKAEVDPKKFFKNKKSGAPKSCYVVKDVFVVSARKKN